VFYGAAMAEASALQNENVFIVGGGNSAGQAALHLGKYAANVTMVVRGESFAESMSAYLIREIDRAYNVHVLFNSELVGGSGEGHLQALTYRHRPSGAEETVPASAVFVFIGAEPHTAWLPPEILRDNWGYVVTGTETGAPFAVRLFETSMAGVFAVGDVRHGSTKRVASAVGEGSICISQVHGYLHNLIGEADHVKSRT
jgi:thioredoxin reductase (NADPH)